MLVGWSSWLSSPHISITLHHIETNEVVGRRRKSIFSHVIDRWRCYSCCPVVHLKIHFPLRHDVIYSCCSTAPNLSLLLGKFCVGGSFCTVILKKTMRSTKFIRDANELDVNQVFEGKCKLWSLGVSQTLSSMQWFLAAWWHRFTYTLSFHDDLCSYCYRL